MKFFNHFNHISSIYDQVFGRNTQTATLNELLELKEKSNLLDAGGGTGRVSAHFLDPQTTVFLVDSAINMLVEAKKKLLQNLVYAEIETLAFSDESFERAIMVDALHHMTDQSKVLDEIWRVLKPEGIFLIEEPDINHFSVKLLNLAEKVLGMKSYFLSPQEIAEYYQKKAADVKIHTKNHTAWIVIKKTERIPE